MLAITWSHSTQMEPRAYTCGYCGRHTGPNQGFFSGNTNPQARIYICTYCGAPTYFDSDARGQKQHPGVPFGNDVAALPPDVEGLYGEARRCMTVNSFTAAVLMCRKLLMHLAVEKGAKPGQPFADYVEYLAAKGYVPPDGKDWVDHIRTKGNEANHEIKIMLETDAKDLITFSEMLLRFMYEFPSKVRPSSPGTAKKP
jgi:uncharacterized protein DUF4145